MKRISLLLLSVMLAVVTYGQSGKAETKDIQTKEVFVLVKVFDEKGKTTATIDFGDGTPRMVFADEKDKMRNFESNFEPISLLIKNGWEIDKFSSMLTNFFTVTLWVMKKKVNEESEIREGMKLINKS
ncbi:MAG: hypothetical protein IJ692_02055 [Alloprevotella sp.]|nr:hypothetical protein [Alloprevotella sp.]